MYFSPSKHVVVEGSGSNNEQQQQQQPLVPPPHMGMMGHPMSMNPMMMPPPHGPMFPHPMNHFMHPMMPPPHQPHSMDHPPFMGMPAMPMGTDMMNPFGPPPPHMFNGMYGMNPFDPNVNNSTVNNTNMGVEASNNNNAVVSSSSNNSNNNVNGSATKNNRNNNNNKESKPTLSEIFDDLASRFVINIPAEELESFERMLFQVEAAYWFYDDFYREDNYSLPKYSLAEFTKQFFNSCPLLSPHKNSVEEILQKFSQYKTRVPVYGAIILNPTMDKALFVRGFHSSSWGFPKGKVNKDEPDTDCAVREVLEETGFDIGPNLIPRHFIEIIMKEQKIKLFIIQNVPEDTVFMPRTRKEISKIEWLLIDELPTFSAKRTPGQPVGQKEKNFFRSIPFFIKLKKWIANRKLKKNNNEATPKVILQRNNLQPNTSSYPESPLSSPRGGGNLESSFYTHLSTPSQKKQNEQQQQQQEKQPTTPYKQPQQQQQQIPIPVPVPLPLPLPTIQPRVQPTQPPPQPTTVQKPKYPPLTVKSYFTSMDIGGIVTDTYPTLDTTYNSSLFNFTKFDMEELKRSFQ